MSQTFWNSANVLSDIMNPAIGAVLAMGTEFLFAVSAPVLISFFTQDKSMVELVQKLMFIDIALEAGRVTNLVYGNALKTSGDAVFPVILGAVFMFLCAAKQIPMKI